MKQGSEAAGDHHVTGTPDTLVERQTVGKQITADDTDRTYDEKRNDLVGNGFLLADEPTTIEAQKDMSDGRDRAEKSFRIDGRMMVKMVVAEQFEVGLCQDVHTGIFDVTIAQNEDKGIDYQQPDNGWNDVFMITKQGKERHNAVAKGNALKDRPDAKMPETQEITLDSMVEPVDKETDGEKEHRPFHDTTNDLRRWLEFRLHQREVARDAHNEEEKRENEVARRQAVPRGVFQHFERLAPAVVYENHAGYRDATENIEGKETLIHTNFICLAFSIKSAMSGSRSFSTLLSSTASLRYCFSTPTSREG